MVLRKEVRKLELLEQTHRIQRQNSQTLLTLHSRTGIIVFPIFFSNVLERCYIVFKIKKEIRTSNTQKEKGAAFQRLGGAELAKAEEARPAPPRGPRPLRGPGPRLKPSLDGSPQVTEQTASEVTHTGH